MKNLLKSLALVAVSALAVVSCQKDELASQNDGEGVFFSLRTGDAGKTYIVVDGKNYKPQWANGDEIGVLFEGFDSGKEAPAGKLTNTADDGDKANFEGTIKDAPVSGNLYAFYPAKVAKTYTGQTAGFDILGTQHPTASSFDPAADLLISKPVDFIADETAVVIGNVQFARALAMLKINVYSADFSDIQEQYLSKLTVTAVGGRLAGRPVFDLKKGDAKITGYNTDAEFVSAEYEEDIVCVGNSATATGCSVFLMVAPVTLNKDAKLKFTGATGGYTFSKEVTLPSDITLKPGKCTEINLSLAESNCEVKVDYSGSYLIVSENHLLTDYNADKSYYNYTDAEGTKLADFWEIAGIDDYVWTVDKLDDGSYSFCNNGTGKYLALTKNSNNAYEADNADENTARFSIAAEESALTIYSKAYPERKLRCNTQYTRFAFYSSETGTIATLMAYTPDPRPKFDAVSGLSWDASGKTLSWTAAEGATNGYEYTKDNGETVTASETNSIDCSSWTNGDYSVKVRVVGTEAKKTSEWSSACEFTISGGVAAKYYRKVSSLLEDYEGKFLILGTGTTSAFTGTGSGWGEFSTVTVDNENGIQSNSTVDAYAVTISKLQSGNYTIQASDNNYIASVTSNTFSMGSTAGEFTFEYSNGHSCVKLSNGRYMKFVSGSGFRMYSSSTGVFSDLYKLEEVALSSITVSGTPTKTAYKAGDDFETAGLIATATYEDASEKDVTDVVEWTVTPSPLTAGTTSVSVVATYKKVSSTAYVVNGLTVTEPAELTSISVKTAPTKVEYIKGEKFDPTGLVISRNYSDKTSDDYAYADHESDFTFAPALTAVLAITDTKVTITYKEKSVDQAISVKSIANTKETAYTVAQARALIDAGKDLDTEVYVKGKISEIVTAYSSSYGNISFNVSDNGGKDGDQFQFYRNFKGANKTKWTDSDTKPAVGNEVIGFGKLTKYGSTYEFAEGNYIVSIKEAPYLNASASKTSVAAAGETVTITVDTNVDGWTVTSDNAAFVVGAKSGNTVPVVVSENTSTTDGRTAHITVSATGVDDKVITLTQSKKSSGTGPAVGTVMWSETWQGGDANETPSSYGQEGTTVYNSGSVTYTQGSTSTKLYNDTMATTNLLLAKSNGTWTISGIPTGGQTKFTLEFQTNNTTKTRYNLSTTTAGVTIGTVSTSGSSSPYAATAEITISGDVGTFDLTFKNTTSSNVRLDNLSIKVAE